MRIAVDTNVLLRATLGDDPGQEQAALEALERAELVAVSLTSLCEFAWVLGGRYGVERSDVAAAVRAVLARRNVAVNRPAVEAGLALLEAGGDFADGVIAYEGHWLGRDLPLLRSAGGQAIDGSGPVRPTAGLAFARRADRRPDESLNLLDRLHEADAF